MASRFARSPKWGWHSFPIPNGLSPEDFKLEMYDTYGRKVGYAAQRKSQERLFDWLRENPHRLNLARIGPALDRRVIQFSKVTAVHQELDLWTGTLTSRFKIHDQSVAVTTCCHPELDAVAFSIESPLAQSGRLSATIRFPYGSPAIHASDWASDGSHHTTILRQTDGEMEIERRLDRDGYFVGLQWDVAARAEKQGPHSISLLGSTGCDALTSTFVKVPNIEVRVGVLI